MTTVLTIHSTADFLHIEEARFTAPGLTFVIGPNGAGKSTLLRAAGGLAGETVNLGKHRLSDLSALERARRVTYYSQRADVAWNFQGREIIELGLHPWGPDPDWCAAVCGE